MTRAAALWLPAAAVTALELFGFARRAPSGSVPALVFVGAALAIFGVTLVASLGVHCMTAPNSSANDASRRARWALALALLPLLLFVGRGALLVLFRRFHNQELSALVGVSLVLALGAGGRALFQAAEPLVERTTRTLTPRRAWLPNLPGALLAGAFAFWISQHSGLDQLDPWLWVTVATFFAGLVLSRAVFGVPSLGGRTRLALLGAGISLCALGAVIAPAADWLGRFGVAARPGVALLRALSATGAVRTPAGAQADLPSARPPEASRAVPSTVPRRPNLVIVTIETLRADRTSLLGYERPTTPELERLGKDAFVFARSYATTPTTRLSLAALLSGRLPSALRWLPQETARQMRHLAAENPWLPATLQRHGYATLAVHPNFRAFNRVENAGFERGFDQYDTSTELRYVGGTMQGFPGESQVRRALSLLDRVSARPFLLWLHLVEPHYLYEQSSAVPVFGVDQRALYDADIAEADRVLGLLTAGLASRGLSDSTVLFVSGDHGEEFGEHGQRWHGNNLYEPQVRTVSVLRVPGFPGRRISEAVNLLDFTPTLLDLLGVHDAFAPLMGRNLTAFLAQKSTLKPGFFLENFRVDNGSEPLFALVQPPHKLIYDGTLLTHELYDLGQDPGERTNLFKSGAPHGLLDTLQTHVKTASGSPAMISSPPQHHP